MKDGAIVQIGTPEETWWVQPAIMGKICGRRWSLTSINCRNGHEKPTPIITFPKDGPRGLCIDAENGISSIFVVDSSFRLQGLLMAEDALKAVEKNEKILLKYSIEIFQRFHQIPHWESCSVCYQENLPGSCEWRNRLMGIIVRGSVMAKLAERYRKWLIL